MDHQLAHLEAEIRHAVTAGCFADAKIQIERYCAAVEGALLEIPREDPAILDITSRALGLLDWARLMAHTARSHAGARLQQLPAVLPFQAASARQPQTWRWEA